MLDSDPIVRYHGRLWDAPLTDDAVLMDDEMLSAMCRLNCMLCDEPMTPQDDLLWLPYILAHLECHLRSSMGDVQHLEKRCLCFRGKGEEIDLESDRHDSYRESARATVEWLVSHRQGRFHHD